MDLEDTPIWKLNMISFGNYLKHFPKPTIVDVGSPIKNKLAEQIEREPTLQELKKYIEIVIMPTHDYQLQHKRIRSLIRLINKNAKENNTRRFNNPNKFHVS